MHVVEHIGAETLGLAQAPLHVPVPFGLPLLLHVEEPVAGDGVHVNFAAFGSAAAGFVFDGPSGSGSMSFDGSELLVCERPVDGFSWSPPGRALQARALRELVVFQDVLL